MILSFKIATIDSKYCDYLRMFDSRVTYNSNDKELRPFIGVLFNVNNYEYFAPLSSPKPKHKFMKNTIDFIRINNGEYGAINFNNMIPVKSENYKLIDLNKVSTNKEDKNYNELLRHQLDWLNENKNQILNKSHNLYNLYIKNKLLKNIFDRCCNFPLLEEKSKKYEKMHS